MEKQISKSNSNERHLIRPRHIDTGFLSLIPTIIWYILFLFIPIIIILVYSFWRSIDFKMVADWTLDNYREIWREEMYRRVFLKSLKITSLVTVISLVLGYLMAYFVAKKMKKYKMIMLFLVIAPFWTSYLLRVYAWMAILGSNGLINSSLLFFGIIKEPLEFLLYSQFSLTLGFVYIFFPFAFLAIYASLEKINNELILAARDLGANPLQAFYHVTLPLSMPGVVAASLFVFLPVLGEYVTPKLLGGPTETMISNLMVNQFGASMQWGIGSALAVVLILIMFLSVSILTKYYSLDKIF